MSRWFRHYAGMMRDDKLVRVAIRSKQPIERVVWVWGAILESASEIDDNGRFDLDAGEIAYFLRTDEADIDSIVSGLEAAGRLAGSLVAKWGDRQFSSDKSRERQAAYRERQKAARRDDGLSDAGNAGNDQGDAEVTSPSRHGDAPETETETETEVSEPKGSSPRAWSLPNGVSLQVWTDFKKNRSRKRLPNTDTAWKAFCDDLARVSAETGIPPPKLIEQCTAKGWGAIYDPRSEGNDKRSMGRNQPADGLSATTRAARDVFGLEPRH